MVTKSELFQEYNGKNYTTERGFNLICILKPSWSLARMQEAIKEWKDSIQEHKAFLEWQQKLFAHAATLGYSEDVAKITAYKQNFKYSEGIEEDLKRLTERLLREPNDRQHEVIKMLFSVDDCHIRLYGDGYIAAANSSLNDWCRIHANGLIESQIDNPIKHTTLYRHCTFVRISADLGIKVESETGTLRVFVYFNMQYKDPQWYDIEISAGINLNKAINMASFLTTPEVALLAAEGLKIAAAIAQDLENFVNNPHEWLQKQCKLPRPYDAVLSR
jgi:hypothetical protein